MPDELARESYRGRCSECGVRDGAIEALRAAARRLTDAVLQLEVNDGRSAWNELLAARAAMIVTSQEVDGDG